MIKLEDFKKAGKIVKEVTCPTDLMYCEYLSKQTGGEIYLKPENKQVTGAYKVRGAYYKITNLSDEERSRGIITASTGNHAQGVAYAALKHLDVKGKKTVCVLSGGNIDVTMLSSTIKRGLLARDRLFFISLPQPLSFTETIDLINLIEKLNGNVIKLQADELVNTNDDELLEMQLTIETFGTTHKKEIIDAIIAEGYKPKEIKAKTY